jgi:hypothetical protein
MVTVAQRQSDRFTWLRHRLGWYCEKLGYVAQTSRGGWYGFPRQGPFVGPFSTCDEARRALAEPQPHYWRARRDKSATRP